MRFRFEHIKQAISITLVLALVSSIMLSSSLYYKPAFAAASLILSPTKGAAGTAVQLNGSSFDPNLELKI